MGMDRSAWGSSVVLRVYVALKTLSVRMWAPHGQVTLLVDRLIGLLVVEESGAAGRNFDLTQLKCRRPNQPLPLMIPAARRQDNWTREKKSKRCCLLNFSWGYRPWPVKTSKIYLIENPGPGRIELRRSLPFSTYMKIKLFPDRCGQWVTLDKRGCFTGATIQLLAAGHRIGQ